MVNCRGCGREGFKHSGINVHCHKSQNPRCREYLKHLKQATGIRARQVRPPAEHSPIPTLNVSPPTGEVSQASNSHQVSKKRTVQMMLDDSEIVTSKRAANTTTTSRAGQSSVPFGLASTIPSSMQGEYRHQRISCLSTH